MERTGDFQQDAVRELDAFAEAVGKAGKDSKMKDLLRERRQINSDLGMDVDTSKDASILDIPEISDKFDEMVHEKALVDYYAATGDKRIKDKYAYFKFYESNYRYARNKIRDIETGR